mgnify:CR=1 FL=1
MKFVFSYVKEYSWFVALTILIKTAATFAELFIPFVLEYLLDEVAPRQDRVQVFLYGGLMLFLTACILVLNIISNKMAVRTSARASLKIRRDLFRKSLLLSGSAFDTFTLPSITSRMTSDSYNLQDFLRSFQSIGIRAPLMLIGGVTVTMIMDPGLGVILCIIAPISIIVTVILSFRGIPLYDRVQQSLDKITLILRENITGIRVVKALSKEPYETQRFRSSNDEMVRRDRRAGTIMSLPSPFMTLFLNVGLIMVVYFGAKAVDSGRTEPGVILAFLTYFNMILTGTMAIGRVLLTISKASASARRISAVINAPDEFPVLAQDETPAAPGSGHIIFDNVSFAYQEDKGSASGEGFVGESRYKALNNISFSVEKGGSLGIIGATGSGKTTLINLLMRFYDASEGNIFVDGRDIRTYSLEELRSRFSVAFQNDMIFAETIRENIRFGRDISEENIRKAAADACAAEFIEEFEDAYDRCVAAKGNDLSGGQKQRLSIARALAGNSEILILDDSFSALDYITDAKVRAAIKENYGCTTIIVAQRVSSIAGLDNILVLDEGRIIGYGPHEELLKTCDEYRSIYSVQTGTEV